MARVPSTHVELPEAVIAAMNVWHAPEIEAAGITARDMTLLARHWFARAALNAGRGYIPGASPPARYHEPKGVPVLLTQQVDAAARETPEIKDFISRRTVRELRHRLNEAWVRLRDMLSAGDLVGYLFDEDTGEPLVVPQSAWNHSDADTVHERGRMRFADRGVYIIGPAALLRRDLESLLSGRSLPTSQADPTHGTQSNAGRKPHPSADRFWIEICRLIANGDVQGRADGLSETMAQWAIDNMGPKAYDADTVRKKVALLFKELGWD